MSTQLTVVNTQVPAFLPTGSALGNENISAADLSTPVIELLQAISPVCMKGTPAYIKGAEAGKFMNSITKEMTDNVVVSNLFFDAHYTVFKKRALGGGDFQGTFKTQDAALAHLQAKGLNPADYDVVDTQEHTVAVLDEATGEIRGAAIIRFSGGGANVGRDWNSGILMQQPNMDRFAGIWKLEPQMRSNSKGSWYVVNPTFMGFPASEEMYQELRTMFLKLRPAANNG